MSMTLEPETESQVESSASDHVRQNFAACRLRFKWFGTTKTLTADQKSLAAESFGAQGESIRAGKKLLDTRHDAFRELTSLKSEIVKFWKNGSLPYPEPGIRLIQHQRIEGFDNDFGLFRQRLVEKVADLDIHFQEMKQAAQASLGELFDPDDYPSELSNEFDFSWDFPSVEPPNYLQRLNPELYQQQADRVSRRFQQAVEMAEQAFLEELSRLVNHLSERLTTPEGERPKVFRDSAVSNLNEFFQKFRSLNIHSCEELDNVVERCQRILEGVSPQELRDNESFRRELNLQMSTVQGSLDQMMQTRPRRRIIRSDRSSEGTA